MPHSESLDTAPPSVLTPTKVSQSPNSTGSFTAENSAADSPTFPPLYEAAILYAAQKNEAALVVLTAQINAKSDNLRLWLMLFDYYRITNNHAEFEHLSLFFSGKFDRPAPIWQASPASDDPRRKERREHRDYFDIKPEASGALLAEIDRLEAFATEMGSARIDFSKVNSILVEEAELFSMVLQRIRSSHKPVWFNGLTHITALLKTSLNESPGNDSQRGLGYWSLLFEIFIHDGKLAEYEELGLEYAMTFEISPPAWEDVVRPSRQNDEQQVATAIANNAPGFEIKGVISPTSNTMLAQLSSYAVSHPEVLVDMTKLLRIDFESAGLFVALIRQLHLAQKRIILSNINEFNAALLEIFGINKHAVMLRNKGS